MKHINTRKQLVLSILSMLLCVSMLVGTTFAWFTDSVTSGMNTIAAGNLDVELLADGVKVEADTKLFDDVSLWEPGVVIYENLQVANVGSLALKYQMSLNFGSENTLNGHKLSEVLQIAVIDKVADTASRADVLAAAQASSNIGTLSNFYVAGALEAGATSAEQSVVIFWAPNANEIDNLYNANNGQVTSDGEPLHIEFGVNLVATQKMSESDSFGNDYDEFASILPKAKVIESGAQTVKVFLGYSEDEIALDNSFQFKPNESKEDAESSAYRYWHADYVVKADKDIKANSIALAGYYEAWCGNNGWVVIASDDDSIITAGTEIRLVEMLNATVNYEEICTYGNDGTGFLCGVKDLTGGNAGTTLTVELRLYETTVDPATGIGNKNDETGEYEVVGTYSHTFPAAKVSNLTELSNAANKGGVIDTQGVVIEGKTGLNYPNATIVGATFVNEGGQAVSGNIAGTYKNCTFDGAEALRWCYTKAGETLVFENCVINTTLRGIHFDGMDGDVIFKNCVINGFNAYSGAGTMTFEGCTFGYSESNYNGLNIYTDTNLIDCTFEFVSGKTNFIDMEGTGKTLTITNCTATLDGVDANVADFVGGSKLDQNTVNYN